MVASYQLFSKANILISAEGRALLCDFGLSLLISGHRDSTYHTSTPAGAARWAAMELFDVAVEDSAKFAASCDVYSFGSIIFQVRQREIVDPSRMTLTD